MKNGFCVWFTGLSASGKTTLSNLLQKALLERGFSVEVLDGDIIRKNLSKGLSFSRDDRNTNIKRIGFVANLLARNGVAVIVAAISPYKNIRDEVRAEIGDFIEIYLDCPLEVCIERDPKGLYRKALAGEIKHFTGIDDPYEVPEKSEVVIRSHEESPQESLARILRTLEILGRIPALHEDGYSEAEAEVIKKRLTDLGYL
ncbi:MAG: adenylyl-sulfate kinase [Deltaproteobacteria bacterium]|nr:adenylyl-sulfate kinase [Deltaproteobacteria bacterium]MBW2050638.1 adenylyl-sulfate kinase [Deltaproteobacteria bacterium]MBW2139468.1 adenylyl-sulfate kinase [Deltaproteobacteria bacterium]MBW2322217.1 adenylyl-sulfate kinase [Deltaproteobacteria bacterium]